MQSTREANIKSHHLSRRPSSHSPTPEPPAPGRILAELQAIAHDQHNIRPGRLGEEEPEQARARGGFVYRGIACGEVHQLQESPSPEKEGAILGGKRGLAVAGSMDVEEI